MIIPPYLKPGSTIAVVGSARTADASQVEASKKLLEAQGFKIVLAPNISSAMHRFAGTDTERLQAFQELLDDEHIDAIWLARGGYGNVRIVNSLIWDQFLKHPKWLIGFSDFTYIHSKLNHLSVASIHACTFVQIQKFGLANENVITALETLQNQASKYTFASHAQNRMGQASGTLVGGNLSLICNSIGTATQLSTEGCILMLEDCDEYAYHYDRMLHQLKRAGMLSGLKGLIIGQSTFKPDPDDIDFGYTLPEMVMNLCKEFNYPICFDAPFGHTEKNYALVLNHGISLTVSDSEVSISQQ